MIRTSIVYVSLLCLAVGARAQDEPDLSALEFTPAPITTDVASLSPPVADTASSGGRTESAGSDDRLFESIDEITESMAAEEARNGTRSSGLIGDLTSLASIYRDLGDHVLAQAALERARQIVRVNEGLHSLDQVAIVEQMLDGIDAAAQPDESMSLQNTLLELTLENEDDPRVPSVLAAVADRQMGAVEAYLEDGTWARTDSPVRPVDGSGWEPSTSRAGRQRALPQLGAVRDEYEAAIEHALTSDDYELGDPLELETNLAETYELIDTVNDFVEEGRLPRGFPPRWEPPPPINDRERALVAFRRARRLYSAAMQAALAGGSDDSGEFLALQERLIETYYFEVAYPELHPRDVRVRAPRSLDDIIYITGASALETKVVDRLTRGVSATEVAMALVELGDWELLFSVNRTALETYQQAHDLLVREGTPPETIVELFCPETPAVLPAFASEANRYDPAGRYRGYIDVAIEIGRYGDSKGVDVLDASAGTTSAIEKALSRHVAQSRFRPRFVDGEPVRSDELSLRYYFDY